MNCFSQSAADYENPCVRKIWIGDINDKVKNPIYPNLGYWYFYNEHEHCNSLPPKQDNIES
jgi:hypothetical protein